MERLKQQQQELEQKTEELLKIEQRTSQEEAELLKAEQELESVNQQIEEEMANETTSVAVDTVKNNIESLKPTTSTYELLKETDTYTRLLKVMDNAAFDNYQTPLNNPSSADTEQEKEKKLEKRLENVFLKINGTIKNYLLTQFDIDPTKEIPPVITEVIVPAIEWYLMDFLKYNQHENNVNNLTVANTLSFDGNSPLQQFTNLLTSVGNIAGQATVAYNKANSLINAIEFLEVHKKSFTKAQQSEILRNPLQFKEQFLQNPLRTSGKNVYAISLQEAGIEF
jgi:hypothetical protein